jgi:nucleoside-diphosphate-sugar epimerase
MSSNSPSSSPASNASDSSSGQQKRVLITGAAGRIGKALAERLGDHYRLRLQYHRTIPPEHEAAAGRAKETGQPVQIEGTPHEVFVGGAEDLGAMERACAGVDALVHMAADPRVQAPWEDILNANIIGTYNAYEAARRAGVRKLVFASSNHATGYYEKERVYTTPEMPVRPDSYYGVSKVFGEALGRYYADEHGMAVICLRIGSFQPKPRGERQLATWISHRDTAQLVWRSIEADPEKVPYLVCYGISGNTRAYWDLTNAKEQLGYAPEDDAEQHAEEVLASGKA